MYVNTDSRQKQEEGCLDNSAVVCVVHETAPGIIECSFNCKRQCIMKVSTTLQHLQIKKMRKSDKAVCNHFVMHNWNLLVTTISNSLTFIVLATSYIMIFMQPSHCMIVNRNCCLVGNLINHLKSFNYLQSAKDKMPNVINKIVYVKGSTFFMKYVDNLFLMMTEKDGGLPTHQHRGPSTAVQA